MTVERKYYLSGRPRYEHSYQEGEMHGMLRGWHDDGKLMYKISYQEGKMHGVAKGWHRGGKLWYDKRFLYGNEVTEEEYRKHELIEKLSGL